MTRSCRLRPYLVADAVRLVGPMLRIIARGAGVNRDPSYHLELPYQTVWEWRQDDAEPYWVVRLAGESSEVVGDGAK